MFSKNETHHKCSRYEQSRLKCNHGCQKNEVGEASCFCLDGYEGITGTLMPNQYCADIDECVQNPCGLDHQCQNTEGSYKCIKDSVLN